MPASARKRPSAYPTSTISARLSASSVSSDLEPWWIILVRVYARMIVLWGSFVCRAKISTQFLGEKRVKKFQHFHTKSASNNENSIYLLRRRWWRRRRRRCTTTTNNNNKDDDHKKRGASFFLPQTRTITRRRICRLLQCLHLCRAALFSAVVVPGGNRPSP